VDAVSRFIEIETLVHAAILHVHRIADLKPRIVGNVNPHIARGDANA
jgi:hypothetical protein